MSSVTTRMISAISLFTISTEAQLWSTHRGAFFRKKTNTSVLTALNRPQAVRLRNLHKKKISPTAFILISNTSEIIGKGFHNV